MPGSSPFSSETQVCVTFLVTTHDLYPEKVRAGKVRLVFPKGFGGVEQGRR
jgi:hypothetical protein